jgi:hypothetical protein
VMGFCLGCGQYLIGRYVACSMIFQAFPGKIQEIIVVYYGVLMGYFWVIRSWKCLFHKAPRRPSPMRIHLEFSKIPRGFHQSMER